MAVQVPKLPERLQASQAPEQLVLQQRPSTQLALTHSFQTVHVWPLAFLASHWFKLEQ
jgi:hypothetical protein